MDFGVVVKKQLRNYSLEECIEIFGTSRVDLSKYVLLITGKINGQTYLGFIKILGRTSTGEYNVGIYHAQDTKQYLMLRVPSLTSIREEVFHFQDHLSFERASFVIARPDCFIRLKCVRSLVASHAKAAEPNIPKLTFRTQSQCRKSLQQIFTSYVRDLRGYFTKEQILEMLKNDICDYLKTLHALIV